MKTFLTIVDYFTQKNSCRICLAPILSCNYNCAAELCGLQNQKTCKRSRFHPFYASIQVFFKIHIKLCKRSENEKGVKGKGLYWILRAKADTADWTAFLLAWEKTPPEPNAGTNRTVTDVFNRNKPSPPFWMFFQLWNCFSPRTLPG